MKNLSPEEAIAILNDMKIDIPVPKAAVTQRKRNVALDMAIEALSSSEFPNSSDTISRQATIDALAKNMPSLTTTDGCGQFDHDIYVTDEAYVDCMQIIHDMPPAQPDIIRCRNCKFASGDSRICMKFGHSPIGELDFCTWAERRTDEE